MGLAIASGELMLRPPFEQFNFYAKFLEDSLSGWEYREGNSQQSEKRNGSCQVFCFAIDVS